MNAILWIVRTGTQWRNLDSKYPKWQSVYYHRPATRFYRWSRNGTLNTINQALNKLVRLHAGRAALPSLISIDSQSVKLAPFINGWRGTDANKKVNGRKRQAAVDTLGLLWAVDVHAAHQADSRMGCHLWLKVLPVSERLEKVLIDASYQGVFTQIANSLGIIAEIAAKPETVQGFVPIKQRWVVAAAARMCKVLKVSVSGYYYYLKHPVGSRVVQEKALLVDIGRVYNESKKRYGSPRIASELKELGILASRPRVARLMKKANIKSIIRKKYRVQNTDSDHEYSIAENHLNRDFSAQSTDRSGYPI